MCSWDNVELRFSQFMKQHPKQSQTLFDLAASSSHTYVSLSVPCCKGAFVFTKEPFIRLKNVLHTATFISTDEIDENIWYTKLNDSWLS